MVLILGLHYSTHGLKLTAHTFTSSYLFRTRILSPLVSSVPLIIIIIIVIMIITVTIDDCNLCTNTIRSGTQLVKIQVIV